MADGLSMLSTAGANYDPLKCFIKYFITFMNCLLSELPQWFFALPFLWIQLFHSSDSGSFDHLIYYHWLMYLLIKLWETSEQESTLSVSIVPWVQDSVEQTSFRQASVSQQLCPFHPPRLVERYPDLTLECSTSTIWNWTWNSHLIKSINRFPTVRTKIPLWLAKSESVVDMPHENW